MPPPPFPVLQAPSEFGAGTVASFEAQVAPHLGSARGLVVDLSGVVLITSAGLGQLVHVGRRLSASGGTLALAAGRRKVVRILRTVGLDSVMPLFESVEDALTFLGAVPASGGQEAT